LSASSPVTVGVDPRLIFPDLSGRTRDEVLAEIARRLAGAGLVREADDLARRLIEREELGCTALGGGIAIPHCKLKELTDVVLAIGRRPGGVDFGAPDGVPVTVLFLVLSPAQMPAVHLQALARVSRWLKSPGIADALRRAETREEIADAIKGTPAGASSAHG
jgi:mannitol/fructose-specific phosphotransferase system IIA component (Ntr-type)